MEVAFAGLEETGEMAVGVWLNPSQVRILLQYRHHFLKTTLNRRRINDTVGATGRSTTHRC